VRRLRLLNKRLARWWYNRSGRLLGYGACASCGNSWLWASEHVTMFGDPPVMGMFVICEPCWRSLPFGIVLRYYACQHMRWWAEGLNTGHKPPPWAVIDRALRAECGAPAGYGPLITGTEWYEGIGNEGGGQ